MIRIHLAQLQFKPAYYDPPTDYLEEPSPYSEPSSSLGRLRSEDVIQSFLFDCKSSYLEHIRTKVSVVASWSGQRHVKILVFPEYSIPYQVLPELRELSQKYSMVIVAGTHRVKVGEESKRVYETIGISDAFVIPGAAISPVFLPDGSTKAAVKLRKSKWEANLITPDFPTEVITTDVEGTLVKFVVIPCIDCLHPDVIGKALDPSGPSVELILCPSLSPSAEPFKSVGSIAALDEVIFCYVNGSSYGGTFFNLPSQWQAYLHGSGISVNHLAPEIEAILELDVEQNMFYMKSGSIKSSPICQHPMMYPIVYENASGWLPDFTQFCSDVQILLKDNDTDSATEWIDSYLAENSQNIPTSVRQNIMYFRHSVLPLFDGQLDILKRLTEVVYIPATHDSASLFGMHINQALGILSNFIIDPENRFVDVALECVRTLKTHQPMFPIQHTASEMLSNKSSKPDVQAGFAGDDDLIEAFQNRGNDLEVMRDFFSRIDTRVILVTGAIGIGKSSFINAFFRKILTDWEVIRIKVPSDTKFPRLLADIGYKVGVPLDIDVISQ